MMYIKIQTKNNLFMNRYSFSTLAFVLITNFTFGQIKDSIGFSILKSISFEKTYDLYDVTIKNGKGSPICIMHSTTVNLFFDPPQRLAIMTNDRSIELFSLHFSSKDTLEDNEGHNPNYNAEVILPFQEIKFRLLIPHSEKDQRISFEYITLPDYCFRDFRNAIYINASTWYAKYIKLEISFMLPK